MKEMYLNEFGAERIKNYLNSQNIKSPNGVDWSINTVLNILKNPFHMGEIVYNKTFWVKAPFERKREKNLSKTADTIISTGSHEQLKTREEHNQILKLSKSNFQIPSASKAGKFPTSSLMICKKCNHTITYSIGKIEKKSGKIYYFAKCNYRDAIGIKCPQKSVKMDEEFYKLIYNEIVNYHFNTVDDVTNIKTSYRDFNALIKIKTDELEANEKKFIAVKRYFEDGTYDLKMFIEAKKFREDLINKLNDDINDLKDELKTTKVITKAMILDRINYFKQNWDNDCLNYQKMNDVLKVIVDKVYYDKNGDTVTLEILYK
jgi:site-specific DNA recombinase